MKSARERKRYRERKRERKRGREKDTERKRVRERQREICNIVVVVVGQGRLQEAVEVGVGQEGVGGRPCLARFSRRGVADQAHFPLGSRHHPVAPRQAVTTVKSARTVWKKGTTCKLLKEREREREREREGSAAALLGRTNPPRKWP